VQEGGREPRRARRVIEVVWKPFVEVKVEERRIESSSDEMAIQY
jgi:hypothetical protein